MAVSWYEAWESGEGEIAVKKSRSEYTFIGEGSDDSAEVAASAYSSLPAAAVNPDGGPNLLRQEIRLRRVGHLHWQAVVSYAPADDAQEEPETGDIEVSFDTTAGGTQKRTWGTNQVSYYAGGNTANLHNGALGVKQTKDGLQIEGIDVPLPALDFSITGYLAEEVVTYSFVKMLAGMKGTVNNATFYTFDAGEVLFNGAVGSQRGRGDWRMTYNFSASQNLSGLEFVGIGGTITVTTKKGWQYLELLYEPDVAGSGPAALVPKPLYAIVSDVFQEADFSDLGIGTGS